MLDIPLIYIDGYLEYDKKSWQWMVNLYGTIDTKKPPKSPTHEGYSSYTPDFTGQQEQRYHLHNSIPNRSNWENSERINPAKYFSTNADCSMYAPLNFHDVHATDLFIRERG